MTTQRTKAEALAALDTERTRFEQEQARKRALLEKLPDDLPFDFVHGSGYKAQATIRLTVENRADVVALLGRYSPLPLSKVRAGCLSFQPTESITERESERAEIVEVAPFLFDLDSMGYPHHVSVRWWHRFEDGLLVQFHVFIARDPAHVYDARPFNAWGQRVSGRPDWRVANVPVTAHETRWSGTEDSHRRTYWWYTSEVLDVADVLC